MTEISSITKDEIIELALKEAKKAKSGAQRTKEGMIEATLNEMQKVVSLDKTLDTGPQKQTIQEVLAKRDCELQNFYKMMRWGIMHATEHQRQAELLNKITAQEQEQAASKESSMTSVNDVKKLNEVVRSVTDWSTKMKARDLSKAGASYTEVQERFKEMIGKDRLVRYTKDSAIIEKELELIGSHFQGGMDYKG